MAIQIDRFERLFRDTAYAIALASRPDAYHQQAVELADIIQQRSARLVTTQAILLEIGNSLSKLRHRNAAVSLLDALENDPQVELVLLTESLYKQGLDLFRERPDKEWSLTDCISLLVMQEQRLTKALTTDQHFIQAGFRILLR